ncbi:MAG: sugar phosphate isomerase/epimerase family protein [Terriglobia bacterium]|jgi:sugar phosphate isomerase/epimerase
MITRRQVLLGSALFPLAAAQPQRSMGTEMSNLLQSLESPRPAAKPPQPLKVAIMSKFLQFLDVPGMAAAAKEMGFDAIDLCVRAGAHVLPDRCEEDLPKAVETIRKQGLEVPMITAAIVDVQSPHAETIMRTANRLGIHHYRWGGFEYVEGISLPEQLESFKPRVRDLAALNRQYGMTAMYHTHSGPNLVGACIWDLWYLLKDFNPDEVGVNYDVGHATVEGGFGGWVHDTRLILPYTRGIAIKDFKWGKNAAGRWEPMWCPLGEGGMVDYDRFFPMVKAAGFQGPVQIHFEYPLGGVENGGTKPTLSNQQIFASMRKDLAQVRMWLQKYQM